MYPKDPREIVPELIKSYNFQTRRVENILLSLRLREVIGASCESKEREDLLIHEILHKLPNVVSTTVNGVTIDDLKEKFIKKNGRLDKKGLIKFLSSLKPYMAFLDENYKVVPSSNAYFN